MGEKKLNCLLIGGGGFVGSWVAKNLSDKGHKVTVLDPFYNYFNLDKNRFKKVKDFRLKQLLKNVTFYEKSFEEFGPELIKKNNFHLVLHLAGHAIEKPLESEISFKQITKDVELTYSIISSLKFSKIDSKLVFMSSSAVYGNYDYATTEYAPLNPKSIYGISKASSELLVKLNCKNWNIVRSNAVYGFGDLGERATHILAERAYFKEKAWVNSSVWCDFIYVKDLAEGIAKVVIDAPNCEIFNISGGKPYKLVSYVEELNKYLSFNFEKKIVNDRPKRGVLDNSKAKMLLDWHPQFDLSSGVKDYMKYVKKYKNS